MDPDRPPTSDLHGALVGILVGGAAAWFAMTTSLMDWAWDGRLGGADLASGRGGAILASAALGGLVAGIVAALLGIVKGRRARLSVLAGLAAGQGAGLCVAAAFVAYAWIAGEYVDVLMPLTLGGAALTAAVATGAVLLVPRRRQA